MIPEGNPYNNWKGNGKSRTFDFDFYIEDETQLAVYHTNSEGAQVLLECGKDYIVNGIGNTNGGNIEFPYVFINEEGEEVCLSEFGILQEGEVISLCLSLPISQENPLGKSSYLNLETLEYSLDYLTRICQILNRQMERSVKTQEGSESSAEELMNALNDAQVDAAASASAAHNSAVEATEQADKAAQEAENAAQIREEFDANCREVFDEFDAKVAADKAELASLDATIKKDADAIINRVGFNMFDTVLKDHILTYEESKGLALQGTWVYKNAIAGERYGYPDFYNTCIKEFEQAMPRNFVYTGAISWTVYDAPNGHMYIDVAEKSKIDTYFNEVGMAWYYIVDKANERIFLPRNIWFEQMSMTQAGKWTGAGLPNITGSFSGNRLGIGGSSYGSYYTGAFLAGTDHTSANWYGSGIDKAITNMMKLHFDASASNPIYGASNTVQPSAVKKLLYICVGNTVSDTSWVDVVTQVEGGVKDLEDKKNTSIAEIDAHAKNYDNLTKRQITNCITEIPQRIKLKYNGDGTITIEKGTVFIVPYGNQTLPQIGVEIASGVKVVDISTSDKGHNFLYCEMLYEQTITFGGGTGALFTLGLGFQIGGSWWWTGTLVANNTSGATCTAPANGSLWFDTANNIVYRTTADGVTGTFQAGGGIDNVWLSLPISTHYGTPTKAEQVFNGFGYIGKCIWADKGVKALLPNGRNEDGTLKNSETITTKIDIRDEAPYTSVICLFDGTHILSYGSSNYFEQDTQPTDFGGNPYAIWFNTRENMIYQTSDTGASWTRRYTIYLGTLTKPTVESNFTSMSVRNAFRAIDYNEALAKTDKQEIISWGMPDYTSGIVIPANTLYSAPAMGIINYTAGNNTTTGVQINYTNSSGYIQVAGKTIAITTYAHGHDMGHMDFCYAFISKAETVYHTVPVGTVYFYPLKGVK